jgi:hypothetical protein
MVTRARVVLPGGLLDHAGVLHRTTMLRPLRGRDEEWLRELPLETTQARAVTEVLARVVLSVGRHRATREIVRALPVGDRDYLAMKLRQITFGSRVELVLVCAACGGRMDADFDLESVPVAEHPQQPEYILRIEGEGELRFRLPRGADQEAAASGNELLACCMVDGFGAGASTDQIRAALDAEIDRVSPQVQGAVDATCPDCGVTSAVRFDPSADLFRELYRRQPHFDRGVHLLSFHYHWPLREILGLSTGRRERYLRLLESELVSA